MQIGKQLFLLEEVIINNEEPSGWSGFTSLAGLLEQAQAAMMGSSKTLKLEFATLTTFNRSNARSRVYGAHYALFPLPLYIFPGLARRWEDVAPPELAGVIQKESIEQYLQDDGMIVTDYDVRPHHIKFTTHQQPGFLGSCTYQLRGPDEAPTGEQVLTVRQQIWLLAHLAFYCGVGYKTAMGMGRVRLA